MPSATDRGLREYLARYKKGWEADGATTGESPYDWDKFEARARGEKHFSLLSDAEWNAILAVLQRAGISPVDEAAVREAIDIETYASGSFCGFGPMRMPDRTEVETQLKQQFRLAEKIERLIPEIREYLGGEFCDDAFDPHGDLHHEVRSTENAMAAFVEHVRILASNEWARLDDYRDPVPNAKRKPEFDRWGAGLIEVWGKVLGQPVENCVALRRFMVACASPYGWLASTIQEPAERRARYFIDRYLAGEVETWRPNRCAARAVRGMQKLAAKPGK